MYGRGQLCKLNDSSINNEIHERWRRREVESRWFPCILVCCCVGGMRCCGTVARAASPKALRGSTGGISVVEGLQWQFCFLKQVHLRPSPSRRALLGSSEWTWAAEAPERWVRCQSGFGHSHLLFALSSPSILQPGKQALEGYKPDTNLPAEPSVWPFPCSFYPSFKSLTGVFRSNKPYVKDVKEQIFCRLYQHAESEGKRAIMLGEGGRSDYLGVIIREGNSGRCCEWQGFTMGHKSLKAKPLGSI